jgi:hypothetical protein
MHYSFLWTMEHGAVARRLGNGDRPVRLHAEKSMGAYNREIAFGLK